MKLMFLKNKLNLLEKVDLNDILTIPITKNANWANDEINNELENNIQGILVML